MSMRAAVLTASCLCSFLGACAQERVVAVRGGLYGLPGAQSGFEAEPSDATPSGPVVRDSNQWESVLRAFPGYEPPPAAGSIDPAANSPGESLGLRRTNPDGSITLYSRTPADVMFHLMTTLQAKEYDLLLDQVIADATKTEYRRRGLDPREAIDFLSRRKDDIAALFATFPMGDQTPGVRMESIGRNTFRLSAPVAMAQELRLHSLDVIIERGNFRLLMIR